jgi:hypothetical protein
MVWFRSRVQLSQKKWNGTVPSGVFKTNKWNGMTTFYDLDSQFFFHSKTMHLDSACPSAIHQFPSVIEQFPSPLTNSRRHRPIALAVDLFPSAVDRFSAARRPPACSASAPACSASAPSLACLPAAGCAPACSASPQLPPSLLACLPAAVDSSARSLLRCRPLCLAPAIRRLPTDSSVRYRDWWIEE